MNPSIRRVSIAFALAVSPGAPGGELRLPPPDLSTYAAIDAALDGEILVPEGAIWRYFPGREEPSPKLEWTELGFGAHDWQEGPSPFGFGDGEHATVLDGMRESGLTTLYLRRVLTLPDPSIYRLIRLELPVDDGYVLYVNGKDEGRRHAGPDADVRMDFDATASSQRDASTLPVPVVDLTDRLNQGDNIIAIQGLNYVGEETFTLAPRVRAWFDDDPAREERRYDELEALLQGGGSEARLAAYLQGRFLQRTGRHAEALAPLSTAAGLDPLAPEPWARLRESHRALGSLDRLEQELRERIQGGATSPALLDAWARVFLEDLGGSPLDVPAVLPSDALLPEAGLFADACFVGRELAAGRTLHVDCGASADEEREGEWWTRDRFFESGEPAVIDGDSSVTVRVATRPLDTLAPVYRVPLPRGAYDLSVAAVSDEPFDLVVEGADVECGSSLRLPVHVGDGFLELDVRPHGEDMPALAALELRPLETDELRELAAARVDDTAGRDAFALAQLAEAEISAGDVRAAFPLLEQASALPGFGPADRGRLAFVRDALLPDVPTIATADDLVARRPGDLQRILEDYREVAGSDEEAQARATYLEGRMLQEAGHVDQAVAFFEELVFSGSPHPEPYVRMAECLRGVQLYEEASSILRDALENGVPASVELVQLLVTLQVDDLKRDRWEMIAELRELDLPDVVVRVPTSEHAPSVWEYTTKEPPATTWSRPTFDASTWGPGEGGIGCGRPPGAAVRALWFDTATVFARQPLVLRTRPLLYPYYVTYADDASDVYLNGTRSQRIPDKTHGYIMLPVRDGAFSEGDNVLGLYGVNVKGPAFVDAGVVEPLGGLEWILTTLEKTGAIRIDCGGGEYVDGEGRAWTGDRFFTGYGQPLRLDSPPPEIAGTDDDALYQAQSWYSDLLDENDNWYQVPLPNGPYRVTLHFAEIDPRITEAGQRVFTVKLEKKDVITEYDVFAAAGFATADVHAFDVDVADGWLDVDLTRLIVPDQKGRGGKELHRGDPIIAAIEIERR